MTGNGDATKALLLDEPTCLVIKAITQVVDHAAGEEAIGIALADLCEIVVLYAVDELLYDNGCCHLCIVHVRKKHLGSVAPVDDEWRYHLHLLTKEERAAILQRAYRQSVPRGVLPEP